MLARRSICTALVGFLSVSLVLVAVWGCRTAPVSGRRQVLIMPEDREIQMGVTAYEEILAEEQVSSNRKYTEIVERVGRRIAAVAGRPDYDWEFRVIASETPNAFALPGGKVAFYEGILPVCQNEAGVAVVMSHEIAHALARHGGERMSHNAISTGVKQVVSIGTSNRDEIQRERIMKAYGVASQYGVLLPYSRTQESEADAIGVMLMAKAGYDPAEAVRFWTRFGEMKGDAQTPEFMSTHPADERRASDLENLLPKADAEYAAAKVKYGLGEAFYAATTNEAPIRQTSSE